MMSYKMAVYTAWSRLLPPIFTHIHHRAFYGHGHIASSNRMVQKRDRINRLAKGGEE